MRADALSLHVYPVITKMNGTQHNATSNICSTNENKLKEFLVDKTLLHHWSTEEDESKSIIVDECSTN